MGTGQLDSAGPIQTRDGSNNPAPAQQTWHVTAAALLNYLFGCTRPSRWLVNSKLQHAGSSSLTRVQTQAPCVGSTESWPLNHWGSHTILLFRMSVQSGFHVTSSCLHCACRHTAADSVPLVGVQRATSSAIFGEQEFGSLFLRVSVPAASLLCTISNFPLSSRDPHCLSSLTTGEESKKSYYYVMHSNLVLSGHLKASSGTSACPC